MSVIQETLKYKKHEFILWEIGNISYNAQQGQDTYTTEMKHIIFRHYYQQTKAIVFFIDSSDRQSIFDSKLELQNIAKIKCLDKIPIIVFCNKQDTKSKSMSPPNDSDHRSDGAPDQPQIFSVKEIAEMIDLRNLLRPNSALTVPDQEKPDRNQEDEQKGADPKSMNSESDSESMRSHENQHYLAIMGGNVMSGDGLLSLQERLDHILSESTEDIEIRASNGVIDIHRQNTMEDVALDSIEKEAAPEIDENVGNWLERQQEEDDATFIGLIKTSALDEPFDHYNLVRLIWIHHREHNSMQEICDLVESFQGDAYNVTITYFWSQIVLYALESISDQELNDKVRADFRIFVACNPAICDPDKLIAEYYSQDMLSKAKESSQAFVMPDIKPLPSLITDVNSLKKQSAKKKKTSSPKSRESSKHSKQAEPSGSSHSKTGKWSPNDPVLDDLKNQIGVKVTRPLNVSASKSDHDDGRRGSGKTARRNTFKTLGKIQIAEIQDRRDSVEFPRSDTDPMFLSKFENGEILASDLRHVDFIRVIWCYFKSNDHRTAVRLMEDKFKTIQEELYHETLTSFWIHMVQYFVILLQSEECATFMEFWSRLSSNGWSYANSVPYNLNDMELWRQFYSEGVMYREGFMGLDASVHLVIPDVSPLPSAVCYYMAKSIQKNPDAIAKEKADEEVVEEVNEEPEMKGDERDDDGVDAEQRDQEERKEDAQGDQEVSQRNEEEKRDEDGSVNEQLDGQEQKGKEQQVTEAKAETSNQEKDDSAQENVAKEQSEQEREESPAGQISNGPERQEM